MAVATVIACVLAVVVPLFLFYFFVQSFWSDLRSGEKRAIVIAAAICAAIALLISAVRY